MRSPPARNPSSIAHRPRFYLDKSLQSTVDAHTPVQHADFTLIRSSTTTDQPLLIILDEDNTYADESQTHEISVKHEEQEPIVDSHFPPIGQCVCVCVTDLAAADRLQRSVLF